MAGTDRFALRVTRNQGINLVRLAGELDMASAPKLRAAIGDVSGPLLLDCERLTFLDASGLRVLDETARSNPTLTLRHVAPRVRRVLDVAGMDALVALEERDAPDTPPT